MLNRSITTKLQAWIANRSKQALLITGARQVGKTTIVREFARQNNLSLAEINFYESPDAKETICQATDTNDMLLRLGVLADKEINDTTLLFLDEIQEFEDILTWVKFIIEQTNIPIILSGSLIGVGELANVRSMPVGFLQKIVMYPMTFKEFCLACGLLPKVWEIMKNAVFSHTEIPGYIHNLLMQHFRKYLLVGGMPNAVQSFIESGQILPARIIQRSIFDLYEDDMTKYVKYEVESRQIKMIYESIPSQLCCATKRFKYTRLDKNLRFANMETAFDWLSNVGVTIESTRVGELSYPLGISENRNSLKLFYNDVGILTSKLMGNVDIDIINAKDDINFGSIYENVVAQELQAAGYRLHYYANKKFGEIDFVLEEPASGDIDVIEVKSGKDYKRHSALNNVLGNDIVDKAIVLCNGDIEEQGRRLYLPVYAVSLFGEGLF